MNQHQKDWVIHNKKKRFCVDCVQHKWKRDITCFYVWSCVAWNYKGSLVFYEGPGEGGSLMQEFYKKVILKLHVCAFKPRSNRENLANLLKIEPWHHLFCEADKEFILQENNNNPHGTCSLNNPVWRYKDEIGLHYYANPPNSPDFNSIENVWRILKQRVKSHKCEMKEQLRWAIQYEWDRITLEEINQYIVTMQDRMDQAVECKGLQTQY